MPFDMTMSNLTTDYLDQIIADAYARFENVRPERRTQLVRAWISNNVRRAVARAALTRFNDTQIAA
ncbi:hypothetical protein [uncultured Ruegeria sp.]|uniref:hypothetical protein n=1 Tax=uncultured Ruegeria sp. TaxID=259304 RepID=UPI00262DE3FF|nr:hypothetical protein [uncultured Ruegeria sp.]